MLSYGFHIWDAGSYELGFPKQGIIIHNNPTLQYWSISIAWWRARFWFLIGWGWRWRRHHG
jgi:hypothetical protein